MKNIATMLSLKTYKKIPHLARSLEKVNMYTMEQELRKGTICSMSILQLITSFTGWSKPVLENTCMPSEFFDLMSWQY